MTSLIYDETNLETTKLSVRKLLITFASLFHMPLTSPYVILFSEWYVLSSGVSATFLQPGGQWRGESNGWCKRGHFFFFFSLILIISVCFFCWWFLHCPHWIDGHWNYVRSVQKTYLAVLLLSYRIQYFTVFSVTTEMQKTHLKIVPLIRSTYKQKLNYAFLSVSSFSSTFFHFFSDASK